MYKLLTEWDMGQDDLIFTSKEKALEYAKEVYDSWDMEESFEDACCEGLIHTKKLTIY